MQPKTGVLLVNLGTPDSPEPRDVHRYLIEFLTDPRVMDIPWLSRQLLVRGVIVPKRFRQSAKAYESIWTSEGSPLKVYGHQVANLLQRRLGDLFVVALAMRYQNPSISNVLKQLETQSLSRLIVLPLFPHYASATTGSVHQAVMQKIAKWEAIPELFFINEFATHPGLIKAFCSAASEHNLNNYDHTLFSYHGLPLRQISKVDPNHCLHHHNCCQEKTEANTFCYKAQCHATTDAIVQTLNIHPEKYSISFQSRLGKDPWLEPFTSDIINQLAKEGKKRILIFCPSFVCDCLETTYEIGIEYKTEFTHAGGIQLDLVPGLNDRPEWIDCLHDIIKERLK